MNRTQNVDERGMMVYALRVRVCSPYRCCDSQQKSSNDAKA